MMEQQKNLLRISRKQQTPHNIKRFNLSVPVTLRRLLSSCETPSKQDWKNRFLKILCVRLLNFIFCKALLGAAYLRCRQQAYVRNLTAALTTHTLTKLLN